MISCHRFTHDPGGKCLAVFTCHGTNVLRRVVERLELSYWTTTELNKIINDLPGLPPFQCRDLKVGFECLQFFCHNALQCIRSLYGDPNLVQDLVFAPEQHYTCDKCTFCIVNEIYTRDWWWTVQVHYTSFE